MRKCLALFLTLWLTVLLVGCNSNNRKTPPSTTTTKTEWTPQKRKAAAFKAGEAVAVGYLLLEKPSEANVEAVKGLADKLSEVTRASKKEGFKAMLPEIEAAIARKFPYPDKKAERLMAGKLAALMVDELDALFKRHPDWKADRIKTTEVIDSFCKGASRTLDEYIQP
jgi:CelD/BcsL family acetyltransferase involved in cellulose biosynthesis